MKIKDLKADKRNYRKHNDRNLSLIKKSVDECGLGRSIVIDSEDNIIGGNGIVSTLDKNTPVRVVETDGSELVVVKRTDLKTDDERRKKLAVMDNSTTDASEFDIDLLQEDFDLLSLRNMGVDFELINDDLTASIYNGQSGKLFFTVNDVSVQQEITQKQGGGLTESYLDMGTYVKSFYSVMCNPNCVKVSLIGSGDYRLHHKVNWNLAVPKIIRERFKK